MHPKPLFHAGWRPVAVGQTKAGIWVKFASAPTQWMAYWQNINGKRSVRSFNVSKYGEEGAKQLAIRARQDGMAEVARQLQIQAAQGPEVNVGGKFTP